MSKEDRSWNEQLVDWMDKNPEGAKVIRGKLPSGTVHGYRAGTLSSIERMPQHTRAFLYKTTNIEALNFDEYMDPEKIKVSQIIGGDHRIHLGIYLGERNYSVNSFAKEVKVDPNTVRRYVRGLPVKASSEERIVKGLKKLGSQDKSNKINLPEIERKKSKNGDIRPCSDGVSMLVAKVNELNKSVKDLGVRFEPSLGERANRINDAIYRISDELIFFSDQDQKTRETLADKIDVNEWGIVLSGLGTITKKDGNPETFVRGILRQRKRK